MKRALAVTAFLVLAPSLVLAACGEGETIKAPSVSNDGGLPGEVYRVTIDGMPCLAWRYVYDGSDDPRSAYAYSGLTCDWSDR